MDGSLCCVIQIELTIKPRYSECGSHGKVLTLATAECEDSRIVLEVLVEWLMLLMFKFEPID
jgi:hypothetical protein